MSIHTRETTGGQHRYEVRLRDASGREYSRTFRTRRDAERFAATEAADRARCNWIDPRLSVAKFAEVAAEWLDCNPAKKASTLARDANTLRNQILPALGHTPVSQITPVDVQQLVTRWSKSLAPRTVVRTYAVLRAVFSYAVDTDRIGRSPCRRIKLPTVRPADHLLATHPSSSKPWPSTSPRSPGSWSRSARSWACAGVRPPDCGSGTSTSGQGRSR